VNQHALGYNFNTRQLYEIAILAVVVTAAAITALRHLYTRRPHIPGFGE